MIVKKDIFGRVVGYLITVEEMETLRDVVRHDKASKLKFDALAIFRDAGLLGSTNN